MLFFRFTTFSMAKVCHKIFGLTIVMTTICNKNCEIQQRNVTAKTNSRLSFQNFFRMKCFQNKNCARGNFVATSQQIVESVQKSICDL